jgi:hypothetical protein
MTEVSEKRFGVKCIVPENNVGNGKITISTVELV